MVVLNVGGYLIYHSNDAEEKLEREERRLRHQEIKLEMAARKQALLDLEASKQEIAEKLVPKYYKSIRDKVEGRTIARFEKEAQKSDQPAALPAPLSPAPLPLPSANGHSKQPVLFNTETAVIPETRGAEDKDGNPTRPA